jgi:hypothetical protein
MGLIQAGSTAFDGPDDLRMAPFRDVRDQIRERIEAFVDAQQ